MKDNWQDDIEDLPPSPVTSDLPLEALPTPADDKNDQVESEDTEDDDSDSSSEEEEDEDEDLTPYDRAAKRIKVTYSLHALEVHVHVARVCILFAYCIIKVVSSQPAMVILYKSHSLYSACKPLHMLRSSMVGCRSKFMTTHK